MPLSEDEVRQVSAMAVYGAAQAMIAAGARPTTALRMAAALVVRAGLGDEALKDLGVSKASLSRWRSEASEYLDEQPPLEVVERAVELERQHRTNGG